MRIPPALTLLCLFVMGALDGTFPGLKLQFPGQFVIANLLGWFGLGVNRHLRLLSDQNHSSAAGDGSL